jgi:hypothetical protein
LPTLNQVSGMPEQDMPEAEAGAPGRGEEPEPVSPPQEEGEVDLQLRQFLRPQYSALGSQIRGTIFGSSPRIARRSGSGGSPPPHLTGPPPNPSGSSGHQILSLGWSIRRPRGRICSGERRPTGGGLGGPVGDTICSLTVFPFSFLCSWAGSWVS